MALSSARTMDNPLNYEAALADCARGRISSIGRIYKLEVDKLRSSAQRLTHDRATAEDIVHDAFAQIIRDAKSFDPSRGSARAWIYSIVRNTSLKALRNAGRERPLEAQLLLSAADKEQQYPCDAENVTDGKLALASLQSMDPVRRATLIMALVDGRTHSEISQSLDVPMGTIKSWIRRELIALRQKLG